VTTEQRGRGTGTESSLEETSSTNPERAFGLNGSGLVWTFDIDMSATRKGHPLLFSSSTSYHMVASPFCFSEHNGPYLL